MGAGTKSQVMGSLNLCSEWFVKIYTWILVHDFEFGLFVYLFIYLSFIIIH